MKATLFGFRHSPRKTRLVADLIRGKTISRAEGLLFSEYKKKASFAISKLLKSAISNAKNEGKDVGNLLIDRIEVGEAASMKRLEIKGRGKIGMRTKRSCHVFLKLREING